MPGQSKRPHSLDPPLHHFVKPWRTNVNHRRGLSPLIEGKGRVGMWSDSYYDSLSLPFDTHNSAD